MDDLQDFARRITTLERRLALQAGQRRLGQSALGGGGLRVHDSGNLTIDGGGSLIIESGDLVLGAGSIDGAALATQFDANFYTTTRTFTGSTSWSTGASITVKAPTWAARTVVGLSLNVDAKTRAIIRAKIDGRSSTDIEAHEWESGRDDRYAASLAWGGVVEGKQEFVCAAELRELGQGWPTFVSGHRFRLSVSAIHYR